MTVAERDARRRAEVHAELPGVGLQHESLPGVEEHALRPGVDPPRQPMLAEQPEPRDGVFRKNSDGNHGHVIRIQQLPVRNNRSRSEASSVSPAR